MLFPYLHIYPLQNEHLSYTSQTFTWLISFLYTEIITKIVPLSGISGLLCLCTQTEPIYHNDDLLGQTVQISPRSDYS